MIITSARVITARSNLNFGRSNVFLVPIDMKKEICFHGLQRGALHVMPEFYHLGNNLFSRQHKRNAGVEDATIALAAKYIHEADAILIGTGAGMGVDSGLPDFRGTEGFWKAYPPLAKLGLAFHEMANPEWFDRDPQLAWGFYGHRLGLYRNTVPHKGFEILREIVKFKSDNYFVFTSNVDGQDLMKLKLWSVMVQFIFCNAQ